jgi:hypothetical protein
MKLNLRLTGNRPEHFLVNMFRIKLDSILPTPILPSTPRLLGGTYLPPAVDPLEMGAKKISNFLVQLHTTTINLTWKIDQVFCF